MPAYLVAETGHAAVLAARTVRVGSDAQADVAVRAELGVAPLHYELAPTAQGHLLRAVDPQMPVLVNGSPQVMTLLKDGDVISAGALHLMFRTVADQPIPAPPSPADAPSVPDLNVAHEPPEPEMPLLRTGYRPPGATPLMETNDDEEESMEGLSEKAKQKRKAEKLMQESLQRTQQRLEDLKSEQNFNQAVMVAVVAVILGCVAYSFAVGRTWKLFLPLVIGIGYGVGWLIRVSGKGIDSRFGYLAAVTALAGVVLSNLLAYDSRYAEYQADSVDAESSEYSKESPEEIAERQRREEQTRREDEQRSRLYEAEFQEQMSQFRTQSGGGGFDPNADEETKEEFDDGEEADADAYQAEEPEGTSGWDMLAFVWIMFGPRSLIAYFLIGGAAYKAAFRYLSNHEASDLHSSGTSVANMSSMSIRERIKL